MRFSRGSAGADSRCAILPKTGVTQGITTGGHLPYNTCHAKRAAAVTYAASGTVHARSHLCQRRSSLWRRTLNREGRSHARQPMSVSTEKERQQGGTSETVRTIAYALVIALVIR